MTSVFPTGFCNYQENFKKTPKTKEPYSGVQPLGGTPGQSVPHPWSWGYCLQVPCCCHIFRKGLSWGGRVPGIRHLSSQVHQRPLVAIVHPVPRWPLQQTVPVAIAISGALQRQGLGGWGAGSASAALFPSSLYVAEN